MKLKEKQVEVVKKAAKFCAVVACVVVVLVVVRERSVSSVKEKIAKQAIQLMYDFGSIEQLKSQNKKLKKIVTSDVYNQVTVDNEERRLNTYLKFTEDVCTVDYVEVTDRYVIYQLKCSSIEEYRNFIFMYEVNGSGKICKLRECELIDFMASGGE